MTTIKAVLHEATCDLKPHEDARLDAELLLSHVLQATRTFLYAHGNDEISPLAYRSYRALIRARQDGQPIAYLIGSREFWSLSLSVNASTLIPRPETELLVEQVLALAPKDECHVLDLGTGSGAIAIALAHTNPHWHITATDIALPTLETAQKNAAQCGVHNIHFVVSDWFSTIPTQQFEIIVSNPPYIEECDPHLMQGDLRFEPQRALASGPDGLDALRIIISQASNFLKPKGILMVEHGYQQEASVVALFRENQFQQITCYQDFQGHPRVTCGHKSIILEKAVEAYYEGLSH